MDEATWSCTDVIHHSQIKVSLLSSPFTLHSQLSIHVPQNTNINRTHLLLNFIDPPSALQVISDMSGGNKRTTERRRGTAGKSLLASGENRREKDQSQSHSTQQAPSAGERQILQDDNPQEHEESTNSAGDVEELQRTVAEMKGKLW